MWLAEKWDRNGVIPRYLPQLSSIDNKNLALHRRERIADRNRPAEENTVQDLGAVGALTAWLEQDHLAHYDAL